MGMKDVVELLGGRRNTSDAQLASISSNQASMLLPELFLVPDVTFFTAKAQGVHNGDLPRVQAEKEVAEHHESLADAYLEKISNSVKGQEQAKQKELAHARADLSRVDAELKKISKRIEVDIASDKPRTLAERAKLIITGGAAIALSVWSVYSMHAFLSGTGILSGWPAWGVAGGPIIFAFVAKEALTIFEGDRSRRIAKHVYIAVTITAAIGWAATFGHEAGSPVTQLNDLGANPSAPVATDTGAYFRARGVAQMVIELFGGGILFHTFFALWEKKSDGQQVSRVVQESPQYLAAEKEQRELRAREHTLEIHIAQIEKWFDSHAPFKANFITRAKGQFSHTLNVLQGS